MGKKFNIEFDGFDKVVSRLNELEGDVKKITEKALKKTHQIVTEKADESDDKANLPAKGKYSTGATERALYKKAEVEWDGAKGYVNTGYSIRKGGLASIFMIYGTPRYMKNTKMYNAFFGSKQLKEIREAQETIFYDAIRKLER